MSAIRQTVYHHGGSRIYREHDGRRDLIADTYTDEHFAEALYAFVLDYFSKPRIQNPMTTPDTPTPHRATAPPESCWLDDEPDVAPTPCVFDDPSETIENCVYATLIHNEGKTKTTCKYYKAPSPPSGSLVKVVSAVIANSIACDREDDDTASEIIAAIADELHCQGDHGVAAWLEREAGR